ncbi:hypothetical protein SPFM6_00137 [Salmonella phage SPFM6]|nr:hypothetical protein SPFM6_00137 [Salmonella phage SPFM6]
MFFAGAAALAPLWSNNIFAYAYGYGLGAIDSLTIQGSTSQPSETGEWRNTMGRLYPISSQFPPIIRLPYAVPYDAALSGQDYNKQGATATKQDCKVTKDGRTYRQMAYQYGMMYGTDDDGSVVPIFHGRIVFFPATMHSRSNSVMLTAQQGNMLTNDPQEWHKFSGYFGTVPNTEFFNTAELKLQGFYPDTGPGPQTILRGDWAYRYWVAAVKDNERLIGSPITLSGSAVEFVDDIDTLTKNTTRKEGWNATIDVYNPGTPHATTIRLSWPSQASKGLTAIEI